MKSPTELYKDPIWTGIHPPQRESTAPWNQPPALPTAENWLLFIREQHPTEFKRSPKAFYRLAEKEYEVYLRETELLHQELDEQGVENEDELDAILAKVDVLEDFDE